MKLLTRPQITEPRISINKLGEYLTANPVRRRAIIKDQQEPAPAIVPRYQKAFPILEEFFKTGDIEIIRGGIDHLKTKHPKSDWEADDNLNTASGLEAFTKFRHKLDLFNSKIERAPQQEQSKLLIGGLTVSVRPDFYLRFEKRNQPFIGALKFHWTKDNGHQLGPEGGIYVATTVHQFLDQYHSHSAKPSLDHCYSIDIFRQAIATAPKSYMRVRKNISAGCEEIADRWNGI